MADEQTTDTAAPAQAGRLHITATSASGISVLAPEGELDLSSGDLLGQAIAQATATDPRIVLDLHQLAFLDSTGVNVLLAAHQTLTGAGGWLRLAAPTDTVWRTLHLVGLDTVIDCHATLHDALAT